MKVRRSHSLAIALCAAAAIGACDSPTDPASSAIKGLDLDAALATTTCVTGATKLVVSVSPTTIAVGAHATPYASVLDASGTALSSTSTRLPVVDIKTPVVSVAGAVPSTLRENDSRARWLSSGATTEVK